MKNKLKSLHANATNCNAADEKLPIYNVYFTEMSAIRLFTAKEI